MTRTMLWALRAVAVVAFIGFIAIILWNLDASVWCLDGQAGVFTALAEFANETRNIIALAIMLLTLVAALIGFTIGQHFVPGINMDNLQRMGEAYFQALGFSLTRSPLEAIPYFLSSIYFLGFQLLIFVTLIVGILSLFRISGRLTTTCFFSMLGLAILGAAGSILNLPNVSGEYFHIGWSTTIVPLADPLTFILSDFFLVAMMCFIYLEASYQVVYFYSLLEPPALREEQLKRQLVRLRDDARQQVPGPRHEVPIPRVLQRMLGSDAFRIMREVIEKKLLRRERLAELEDIHEIRRLNAYVDRLFRVDPESEATLTAKAAAPSLSRMAVYSIGSTVLRFICITIVSYFCFYPLVLLRLFAPPVIVNSVDFMFLPEKILILLLPLSLLFPLAATIIGRIRQRRVQVSEITTTST
ncbi:MAG: hypothetical protein ACFFDP_13245 [Promethearchaeota archaeon]